MERPSSVCIQLKFVRNFLIGFFGNSQRIPSEIVEDILAFLFCSPFRHKNTFILKQGTLLIQLNECSTICDINSFILSHKNQQIFTVNGKITLKQNDQLLISKSNLPNQRIKISKIWLKPSTRTQKKILAYLEKFKEFIEGKHHKSKTIESQYLKRQFLVAFDNKSKFEINLAKVLQKDANYCSPDVINAYVDLITKNYIQIQVQSNQFKDKNQKLYKIIVDDFDTELFEGIQFVFDKTSKYWKIQGATFIIWKQQQTFSRKKTLFRTINSSILLAEGSIIQNVHNLKPLFNELTECFKQERSVNPQNLPRFQS